MLTYFTIFALISSIISLIFVYNWYREQIIVNKETLLYLCVALPLSYIVNVFVKRSINLQIIEISKSNNINIESVWFVLMICFIGSMLEEVIKLFAFFIMIINKSKENNIYFIGLLTGIGFGIGEAWYLSYSYVLKKNKYLLESNLLLLLFGFCGERVIAIIAHMILMGLIAYGLLTKKLLRFFFLAVILHFTFNISAILYKLQYIVSQVASIIIILCLVLSMIVFFKFDEYMKKHWKEQEPDKERGKLLYEKGN